MICLKRIKLVMIVVSTVPIVCALALLADVFTFAGEDLLSSCILQALFE